MQNRSSTTTTSLMTAKEAANFLAISEKHLYNLSKKGAIPRIVLGSRAIRYRQPDLEVFIAQQTVGGLGDPNSSPTLPEGFNPEWN